MPHSCQVEAVSPALFCWYSGVVFTDQPGALHSFSAAVSPHTERCTGYLAAPVRSGASHQRSAQSTVTNLHTSSLGSKLFTQAVLTLLLHALIACSYCMLLVATAPFAKVAREAINISKSVATQCYSCHQRRFWRCEQFLLCADLPRELQVHVFVENRQRPEPNERPDAGWTKSTFISEFQFFACYRGRREETFTPCTTIAASFQSEFCATCLQCNREHRSR